MTPFILIEDNHRLTLLMCQLPRERYTWFLLIADCATTGFGPDRLVAASAKVNAETEARKEGMTALLEQKRQIVLPSAVTVSELWGDTPVPLDRQEIDLLLDGMSDRADDLADTLKLIRRRLSQTDEQQASEPVLVNEFARQPLMIAAEKTWRLSEGRFSLLSPDDQSIALSRTEQQFLLALFQSPGCQLTYQQAYEAIAPQEGALPRSHGSLSVLLSRLRTKFRKLDLEFPLHTVRGQGYVFAGKTTISPT